jgi:hypothetical protein
MYFDAGPAPRSQLLATARSRRARRCLLLRLGGLPNRTYRDLHDRWTELPEIPDTYDPWEDLGL